jgi:hypothetical protein
MAMGWIMRGPGKGHAPGNATAFWEALGDTMPGAGGPVAAARHGLGGADAEDDPGDQREDP